MEQARKITVPSLVVYGDKDRITPPAGAEAWGSLIPGARVLALPDSGHLPLAENPGVTLPAIRDFLAAGGDPPERPDVEQAQSTSTP